MKRLFAFVVPAMLTVAASAQTLKIHSGQITVAIPAEEAGRMTYENGTSLTVCGKTYDLSGIDSLTIDRSVVAKSTVAVAYDDAVARVTVSGDIASHLDITASAADISVIADAELQDEVTYVLSGTSADGSFMMDGEYKATLELDGLTLTSKSGPAINIENGKRIRVVLRDGTTTTLADANGGAHKACFFVNGHPEFSGNGNLVLTGNSRHAFASDEYTYLRNDFGGRFEVKSAVGDGLHVEQYFRMRNGTLIVAGTSGDCVDVSSTKNADDELNGQVLIEGGTLDMAVAADDVKGLKSENLMTISGGRINATVSGLGTKGISAGTDLLVNDASGTAPAITMSVTGTTYMPDDPELESKCRGVRVKGDFTFDGGDIRISATGKKSKAVKVDGDYIYRRGTIDCKVEAANT